MVISIGPTVIICSYILYQMELNAFGRHSHALSGLLDKLPYCLFCFVLIINNIDMLVVVFPHFNY